MTRYNMSTPHQQFDTALMEPVHYHKMQQVILSWLEG